MVIKIAQNTIINYGGSAIEALDDDKVEISECLIIGDRWSFWSDPLLWLGLKIMKRKYNQIMKVALKPIDSAVIVGSKQP